MDKYHMRLSRGFLLLQLQKKQMLAIALIMLYGASGSGVTFQLY